jgi:hypothetical protein
MLFKEIITVYSENRTKTINTLYAQNKELLNIEAGGSYNYDCALKGISILSSSSPGLLNEGRNVTTGWYECRRVINPYNGKSVSKYMSSMTAKLCIDIGDNFHLKMQTSLLPGYGRGSGCPRGGNT